MAKIDIACLIDDDPIFVFGAKKMMELANFCNRFLVYKNGDEAIKALSAILKSQEGFPDIILLDLNMPILDGWQFLDEFLKIEVPKKILIYVVSSSKDPSDINRAKSYKQVNNFVVKPISMDDLKAIIQDVELTD
ncbi:response regulator [Ascidiimonas sp. W6]|uniref:response regulator n=1 Tax=Ascidiimonas meishanensis TaxID=3128903 RepID=UPI0030EC09BD